MLTIKNVKTLNGTITDQTVPSKNTQTIDAQGRLMLFPALTDTDASLGPVGTGETWVQKCRQYLKAGFTTIFDTSPQPASTLVDHRQQVNKLLSSSNLPLNVFSFCDGNLPAEFDHIGKVKSSAVSLKISLDLAGKPIAPPHTSSLDRLFQLAAMENIIVTISLLPGQGNVADQRKTALAAVEKAVDLAQKYSAELCLQHVRTQEEIDIIKHAKQSGILTYVEVAYQHLFLNDTAFPEGVPSNNTTLFLPNASDQEALWSALNDGTIDMLGSAGVFTPPGLLLPMLLEAHARKQISLDKLISTTRVTPEAIFRLPQNSDCVLVDLETKRSIPTSLLKNYPLLSAWKDKTFIGWPAYVISGGEVLSTEQL